MTEPGDRDSLDDFARRLAQAQDKHRPPPDSHRARQSAIGQAMQIGTELVAGPLVGAAIGYGFDLMLGTKPWLMVVFLFLGGGAGLNLVIRSVRRNAAEDGQDDGSGLR